MTVLVHIVLEKYCFDPSSLSSTHTSDSAPDSASEKRLMTREINVFIIREKERERGREWQGMELS